jgi:hypothetical protein
MATKDLAPKIAALSFADFKKAKENKTRDSSYAPFILGMKPGVVYDASGTFPTAKSDSVRGALYKQARKLGKRVSALTRDGHLYLALAESKGKE